MSALKQGLGHVNELRLAMCSTAEGSAGLRSWVLKNYSGLKAANPTLPILVREGEGAKAVVTARFGFGEERAAAVEGLDEAAVDKSLTSLIEAGKSLPKQ